MKFRIWQLIAVFLTSNVFTWAQVVGSGNTQAPPPTNDPGVSTGASPSQTAPDPSVQNESSESAPAQLADPSKVKHNGGKNDVDAIGNRKIGGRGLGNWYSIETDIKMGKQYAQMIDSSSKSACSGIYKSVDAGHTFQRMESIPFSARRTRVLKQDPNNPAAVYAGTTEGLWVTRDYGATWKRVTSPETVVNDVLVDPRDSRRVLLATDRGGVLVSDDGQLNFVSSNSGFTHRYISSILIDKDDLDTIYVGVVNDREFGGVFVSKDAGRHWLQRSAGLDRRDVFALRQADDGSILAGTNRGIYALSPEASEWTPLNTTAGKTSIEPTHNRESESLASAKINDIGITPKTWFAATSAGLYTSSNDGKTWTRDTGLGKLYLISVRATSNRIVVASPRKVLVSAQGGDKWGTLRGLPAYINSIRSLTITPRKEIIIGSSQGAFRHLNAGWARLQLGPSDKKISFVAYDESKQRLLATTADNTGIFESRDGGHSWRRDSDTGYPLRELSLVYGRLVVATRFEGVILQNSLPY